MMHFIFEWRKKWRFPVGRWNYSQPTNLWMAVSFRYFDDHEGSISNCSGNVLYKAAGRAFLVNGGAGNNITHNLVVNSGVAIYNQHADNMVKTLPLYDNGTLKRGDKSDYIWKTEMALGVKDYQSLFNTSLAKRFPSFAKLLAVNSTTEVRLFHLICLEPVFGGNHRIAPDKCRINSFLNRRGLCFAAGLGVRRELHLYGQRLSEQLCEYLPALQLPWHCYHPW